MTKKKYLAFLIFSLILTIVLSGLLVTKILKNEASKDIKYIKTTINSKPQENDNIANVKTTNINIYNIQNEETPVNISYEYKITIEGIKGIKKYKYKEEEKYLRFNDNNEATFTLDSNEEITIYDIPINIEYSIEQSISDKYQAINNNSNNLFNGKTANENNIEFKNTSSVVTTNPMTNPKIIILFAVDFIIIIVLISLRKTKVQKYEDIS